MVPAITFDTNCLIAVDEDRPGIAGPVRSLLELASAGLIDAAMVATAAAERQPGGLLLKNISEFRDRMSFLGFGHLHLLKPTARYNMSFYGYAIYPTPEQAQRQQLIFEIMFPRIEYGWAAQAAKKSVDVADTHTRAWWEWRNAMLDVQAFWAHDQQGRNIFVTSDSDFSPLLNHPDFPNARILSPEQACSELGV